MDSKPFDTEPTASYRFRVEVTVQAPNDDAALEQLIHALQAGRFADFRILSCTRPDPGAAPGKDESAQRPAASGQRTPVSGAGTATPKPSRVQPASPAGNKAKAAGGELESRIQSYIDSNRLIRLHINKGRGVKLDIPCRILNLDAETRNLSVYHVDEKQVYIVRLNEVDDIIG